MLNLKKIKKENDNIVNKEDNLQLAILAGKLTSSLLLGYFAVQNGISLETIGILGADALISVGLTKLLDVINQKRVRKVADSLKGSFKNEIFKNKVSGSDENSKNLKKEIKQHDRYSIWTLTANGLVLPLQLHFIANINDVALISLMSLLTICSALTIAETFIYEKRQTKKINEFVKSMNYNDDEFTL